MNKTRLLVVGMLLAVCLAVPSRASVTVVARELFEGVGTLNGSTPGNLGTWISGEWHKRPVGPHTPNIASPGWSGDAQGTFTESYWDLAQPSFAAAHTAGMVGCWVRFTDFGTAGYYSAPLIANPAVVLKLSAGGGNSPAQIIGITGSGQILTRTDSGWTNSASIAANQWYWLQIEWSSTNSSFRARASYQPLNGTLVVLSTVSVASANYFASRAHVIDAPFNFQPGQYYKWRGRLGGATLASISEIGDGAQVADLLPPIEERHIWYLNPATGNDAYDGLSSGAAWRSVSKFNAESANAGLLSPASSQYADGDTLIIDTSAAPLELGTNQMRVSTVGLIIQPAPGQSSIAIRAHTDISSPNVGWLPHDALLYPNIWKTTDNNASDLTDIVVWEDDKWLNHPTGASITSVLASLNSLPGSFFSDGTNLYLHPFGSTDPNTDGKSYTRSRFRSDGGSAVMLLAPNLSVTGLEIRKTTLARSTDNNPYNAYGIQGDLSFGGVTVLRHCRVIYGGKHCIGFTDSGSNRDVLVDSCQVEQGPPYANQNPWVDYNGNASATNNRTTYLSCSNLSVGGVIGSTAGTWRVSTSYFAHNNGSGTQFSRIEFNGGTYGGLISNGGSAIDTLSFFGTTLGGGDTSAKQVTVTRCVMTQLPVSNSGPGGMLTARNNLCVFSDGVFNASYNAAAQGTIIYEGNTFDLRPFAGSDNDYFALFRRVGALVFTFRNNIFLVPTNKNFNVMENATSADTLTFSHNLYQLGRNLVIMNAYNDGVTTGPRSLAQWQALGKDTDSQNSNLLLDVNYFPGSASPALSAGLDLGSLPDFTGRLFNHRRTIGALEPLTTFARWQADRFNNEQLTNVTVSGLAADPDGDGVSNVVEYAVGGNPMIVDSKNRIQAGFELFNNQTYWTVKFSRLKYAGDISYLPELSSDLLSWQGIGSFVLVNSVDQGDGTEVVTIRDAQPVSSDGGRFFRLNFTLSDGNP